MLSKLSGVMFPKNSSEDIIGIALILNTAGAVLIDRRMKSSHLPGMWEFPGGKQQKGESIKETVKREAMEELGIDIYVDKKLLSINHDYGDIVVILQVYICSIVAGIPKPLASQELRWVKPAELFKFNFPSANDQIITELNKYCLTN